MRRQSKEGAERKVSGQINRRGVTVECKRRDKRVMGWEGGEKGNEVS